MMMTSTFPTTKSNISIKNGIQEIRTKKEALISLESALKKRINELRELCLKEGELTGHLPSDYPLQPREPIPQIQRRINNRNIIITNNNNNLSKETNSITAPNSMRSRQLKLDPVQPQTAFAISTTTNTTIPFPSRPTSTNSTSSSISTASSNQVRGNHQALNNMGQSAKFLVPSSSGQLSSNNGLCFNSNNTEQRQQQQQYQDQSAAMHRNHLASIRYDQSMLPNHFKQPFNLPAANSVFDSETLGQVRASSTASSSSSSGSGASSTMSVSTVPNFRTSNGINMNLHTRSQSESLTRDQVSLSNRPFTNQKLQFNMELKQRMSNGPVTNGGCGYIAPTRPPRGLSCTSSQREKGEKFEEDNLSRHLSDNIVTTATIDSLQINSHDQNLIDASAVKSSQSFKINGLDNFLPYYEETKPFQMSDFYKYSSKHRQKTANDPIIHTLASNKFKTTRQLQDDVLKKNSLKFSSTCDDQIQASVKLIEKSGQKLIEATAKAIASNPGLAEKINNILPKNGDRY